MRATAHFFSFVFHPLLVLFYMTLMLLWTNPFSFGWRHVAEADTLLIIIGMTSITLPALSVLMMKMLGWVQSFQMENRHERIGPYIVSGLMYLSLYLHVTHAGTFPVSLRVAVLGTLITLWACFLVNNFDKVSVHAAGMGGLVIMTALISLVFGYRDAQIGLVAGINLIIPTMALWYAALIIAGMVCTSRLILKTHTRKEVYTGFLLGAIGMLIAYSLLT